MNKPQTPTKVCKQLSDLIRRISAIRPMTPENSSITISSAFFNEVVTELTLSAENSVEVISPNCFAFAVKIGDSFVFDRRTIILRHRSAAFGRQYEVIFYCSEDRHGIDQIKIIGTLPTTDVEDSPEEDADDE